MLYEICGYFNKNVRATVGDSKEVEGGAVVTTLAF